MFTVRSIKCVDQTIGAYKAKLGLGYISLNGLAVARHNTSIVYA